MLNADRTMKSPQARTAFPLAEGVGIFVGIASWYLLSDGQLAIAKSLAVATPLTLLWYGLRCWKNRSRNK